MDSIDHLVNIGLSDIEAVVLMELNRNKSATASELEDTLKMERRKVSKALEDLEKRGIISASLEQKPDHSVGGGRPAMVWWMKVPLLYWLDKRAIEERTALENNKEKIDKLKRYCGL